MTAKQLLKLARELDKTNLKYEFLKKKHGEEKVSLYIKNKKMILENILSIHEADLLKIN